MIKIKTVGSSIVNPDGSPSNGTIFISVSSSFEFTDFDLTRKKISTEPIEIKIVEGLISVPFGDQTLSYFWLAPTTHASQDKQNLSYEVIFQMQTSTWLETWTIDGTGPAELEITDVTQV